jgi:hypothetical protein
MKRLIIQLILIVFAVKVSAQTANVDTSLKFNNLIIFCEKQWVVMPKPDTVTSYTFGYVYIDGVQGIMFQKKGTFTINNKGRYVGNKLTQKRTFPQCFFIIMVA